MRRTFTTPLLLMVAVALAPTLGVGVAHADEDINAQLGQPADPKALAHLKQGNGFYKIGEFDKAIEEYKAGSLAEAAGVFQFNIAQSYRQQGNYEKAIWHYERFLAMRQPTGELKIMVDGFIKTMKDELEKAAARQEPTAPGPIDAAVADSTSTTAPPAEPAVRTRSWATGRRKAAIAIGAAGLIAIGAGAWFGVRAQGFEDDAEELCPDVACSDPDEANRLLEPGQDNALYANVSFGVGLVAIAGAAVLWFTGAPDEPVAERLTIRPFVSPHSAGVGIGARF